MKKTFFSLFAVLAAIQFSYTQWTTSENDAYNLNSGNIGIGTSKPVTKLHVNGAIGLWGTTVIDAQTISTASDGTYVIASGGKIKGLYSLSFEGTDRVQTAVLAVDATQFNGGANTKSIKSPNF